MRSATLAGARTLPVNHCEKVRVVTASDPRFEFEMHPAFHNKNLLTVLNGGEIHLAGRHAKVRRDGYGLR